MSLITPPDSHPVYHLTRRDRLAAILRDGLRINSERTLTDWPTSDEVRAMYGCIPVFVSAKPWVEREQYEQLRDYGNPADFVLLRVDISGLPVAADIISLTTHDAYLEEDHLWFEADDHPLAEWVDPVSQAISYERLIARPDLIAAANRWTGTAAVMSSIGPERIAVVA